MVHRYYRISIHIGPIRIASNSRIYEIKDGNSTIIPGLPYSLLTLLFGWWGFRWFRAIQESSETIGVNFSGGVDISKVISEGNYDEDTNYIWNNLCRATKETINKDDLETVLSLQYEFSEKGSGETYSEINIEFLLKGLEILQVQNFDIVIIEDLFEALQMYESKEV